jgi:hypothetical protein
MLARLERLARLTVAGKKSGLPRVIRPKEFRLLEKIENVFFQISVSTKDLN